MQRADGSRWRLVALLAGAIGALLSGAVHAATDVGGPIAANTTWTAAEGPYEVTAEVTVQGSAVLTIEAGTRIVFRSGTGLTVAQGTLRALGRADAPIVFTSARDVPGDTPAAGDWGHLTFADGTNDAGTAVEHAVVQFGSGIRVQRASPALNALRIDYNSGPAIAIDLASSPTGTGLAAEGNQLDGVLVPAGETEGDVVWGLVGIPYVVAQGMVSVGAAPRIQFAVPGTVEQGSTTQVEIVGTRLGGADRITFADPQVRGRILAGGTATSLAVEIEAGAGAALGASAFELQTDAGTAGAASALTVVVPLPPIAATDIEPDSIRRGQTLSFRVTGANLQGAALSVSNAGLSITDLQTTPGEATFKLTASGNAPLGVTTLTLVNPAVARGTASVQIQVNRALPVLSVSPAVLAVPPDNTARQFRVSLTEQDEVDRQVVLNVRNPALATVEPTAFTFAAGQTQQTVSIRGLALGQTVLDVTADGLAPLAVPLYVTPEFNSINTAYAGGVRVERVTAPSATPVSITPLVSRQVRLGAGRFIAGVSPATLTVGTVARELIVSGAGLQGVTGAAFTPADGITLGEVVAAADGTTVRALVTVAADAPLGPRQVTLAGAHQPYLAVSDSATRVVVVPPPPRIASVAPIVIERGATGLTLKVSGQNLQNPQALGLTPATGIALGAATATPDGTSLTVGVNVAADAPIGPRVLVVTTAAGSSSPLPEAANTIQIVTSAGAPIGPLVTRPVKVVKAEPAPAAAPATLYSAAVRVGAGAVATGVAPAAGAIGERITLTVSGNALQAVTTIELIPSTGLVVGTPVAGAGSASVSVDIAADAPQTLRRVRVLAGAQEIAFVDPARALFRVTAPQPAVSAIDPIAIQAGAAPVTLTVFGSNFQNAERVSVVPADGMTIGLPPVVNAQGTEIRVSVGAAAGAAPGPRAVVVTTPAGDTSQTPTSANTLRIAEQLGPAVTPLTAPVVRVLRQTPPATQPIGPVLSQEVRVRLEQAPPAPVQQTIGLHAQPARVGRGTVATTVVPAAVVPGSSVTLNVSGAGLADVIAVILVPADDISIDTPVSVTPDGASLSVQVSVGAAATSSPRTVVLTTASGKVAFADVRNAVVQIALPPAIDSITPITARRGEVVGLTVRGSDLTDGASISVVPAEGIQVEPFATRGADGALQLRLLVAPDAPLGARVIRVTTPGGTTTATPGVQNTLTIFP